MNHRLIAVGLFLALPCLAFGQTTSDTNSDADDAALMSGPKVSTTATKKTLVARTFEGTLTIVEDRPEFAAVALLELDGAQRAAYTAFCEERAAGVSALLQDEYALFLELQGLRQSGAEPSKLRPLMMKFREAAGELADPPLRRQVAAILPEDRRAEYLAIVDEYLEAFRAEYAGGRGPGAPGGRARAPASAGETMNDPMADKAGGLDENGRGRRGAFAEAMIGQRTELGLLLREVARSLNGLVEVRRERSEEMFKAVDATPEQEAKIDAIVRQRANPLGEPNSKGERAELFQKIAAELTPEQRRKLMEYLRNN